MTGLEGALTTSAGIQLVLLLIILEKMLRK